MARSGEKVAKKKAKKVAKKKAPASSPDYENLFADVAQVIEGARRAAVRSVNAVMTATYWLIGRRIVEAEQAGKTRAQYGKELIERLSADLSARFGRGFGRSNLFQVRAFYLAHRDTLQTASGKSSARGLPRKVQTLSGQSAVSARLSEVAACFPLPWSHYVRLLAVKNEYARTFYEAEALRCGWTIRQLDRQIQSQFYERTALSRNKAAMLTKGQQARPEEHMSPEEEIKDPYVLEFLGLKDEYSGRHRLPEDTTGARLG